MIQLHHVLRLMNEVIPVLVFCGGKIADSDGWQTSEGLRSKKS